MTFQENAKLLESSLKERIMVKKDAKVTAVLFFAFKV